MKLKNKILLPKPHISYTQLTTWERSPETYRKRYILGEQQFISKQMVFGKEFAKDLELAKGSNLASDALLNLIRLYLKREVEVRATLKIGRKTVVLFGILDGYDQKYDELGEYKTGVVKWTQKMVDGNDQITFYNTIKYLKTKKLYKLNILHWIETMIDEKGQIQFTGNFTSFSTTRKIIDVLKMKKRIENFVIGVSKMMQEEINKI